MNETLSSEAHQAPESGSYLYWVGVWALCLTAVLYWVGMIGFSPLDAGEWIGAQIGIPAPDHEGMPRSLEVPLWFIRELVAGLGWMSLIIPWYYLANDVTPGCVNSNNPENT